mmetsp:Transcript_22772/g.73279  ORF Transcript_22772/g.73279 Transcript_22772/m.73279 type:complete len:292 (-) Transcript_22772:37-912(-)
MLHEIQLVQRCHVVVRVEVAVVVAVVRRIVARVVVVRRTVVTEVAVHVPVETVVAVQLLVRMMGERLGEGRHDGMGDGSRERVCEADAQRAVQHLRKRRHKVAPDARSKAGLRPLLLHIRGARARTRTLAHALALALAQLQEGGRVAGDAGHDICWDLGQQLVGDLLRDGQRHSGLHCFRDGLGRGRGDAVGHQIGQVVGERHVEHLCDLHRRLGLDARRHLVRQLILNVGGHLLDHVAHGLLGDHVHSWTDDLVHHLGVRMQHVVQLQRGDVASSRRHHTAFAQLSPLSH